MEKRLLPVIGNVFTCVDRFRLWWREGGKRSRRRRRDNRREGEGRKWAVHLADMDE